MHLASLEGVYVDRLESDEAMGVEARIAEELLRLTRVRRLGGRVLPPPPYVRRHLVDISPTHSDNVNYFGSITVDIDCELAQLDPAGYRPLRSRSAPGAAAVDVDRFNRDEG